MRNGSFQNVMQIQNPASADRSPESTVDIADHEESTAREDEVNDTAAKPSVPECPSPLRREGTWSVYRYYYQSAGFIPFATCLAFIVMEAVSGDFTSTSKVSMILLLHLTV